MQNVLLVALRSPFMDSDRVFPPLGILYLKSFLLQFNYQVDIEDDPTFAKVATWKDYDLIGFSVMTPQGRDANLFLHEIKQRWPNKICVIGGPHALHYTDEVEQEPWDYIVRGDGEHDLLKILQGKMEKRISTTQASIDEMNNFPLPYRDREFLHRYQYILDGEKTTTLMTSKGCCMGCNFCEDRRTPMRNYTIDRVYNECKEIKSLGFNGAMAFDDILLMLPKRTIEMFSRLKELDMKFRGFAHANTLKPAMAQAFKDGGGVEVGFGCEHAAQKILDVIDKGVKTHHNELFLQTCRDVGLRVKAFFMLGLPGEDWDTIKELEEFIAKHTENGNLYDFDCAIFYPYKGTYIRQHIEKFDIEIVKSIDSLGYYKGKDGQAEAIVRTKALTSEEIKHEKERIYRTYNKRFKN